MAKLHIDVFLQMYTLDFPLDCISNKFCVRVPQYELLDPPIELFLVYIQSKLVFVETKVL